MMHKSDTTYFYTLHAVLIATAIPLVAVASLTAAAVAAAVQAQVC
jgi:hypothetical protein